jgi:hypothetical protein
LISGFFVIVFFFASGCSRTTMREINEKHKAEIESVLTELRTLADSMPQEDFDPENKQLDLVPYMHVADLMSNAAMGSKDQFLGVNKDINAPVYFNMWSFAYEYMLQDRFAAKPAEPTFEAEVLAFIELRYIIIYHPVDYRDAIITDKEFSIQPLQLVVAMYDRKTKQWIFAKTFKVEPPETIEFSYRDGQKQSNAEFKVKEFFIDTVKPQIDQYIENQLGATIEFDHDAYRRDGTRRLPY